MEDRNKTPNKLINLMNMLFEQKKTAKQAGKQPNNPLHGIRLETVVDRLQAHYGWEELGRRITIRCFTDNPSIKSSLTFLRKTEWARARVEALYLETFEQE